jgi:hypothetical protein
MLELTFLKRRSPMSTTKTNTNGQPRRQLADQIDRLETTLERMDGVLDAMSNGLNEAVQTAVETAVAIAVRQAIENVMTELIAHPAVQEMLKQKTAPHPPENKAGGDGPSGLAKAWNWVTTRVQEAAKACTNAARIACTTITQAVRRAPALTTAVLAAGAGVAISAFSVVRDRLNGAMVSVRALIGRGVGVLMTSLPALT